MEVFLRVEYEGAHLGDVEARVEPSHTVRDLVDAVVAFLGPRSVPADAGQGSVSLASLGPVDEDLTVARAGILSGETLRLGRAAPLPRRRRGGSGQGLALVVASGPDCGRSVPLGPGGCTVGRDRGCDLVLTDPQVSRRHFHFGGVGARDPRAAGGPVRVPVRVLAASRNEARAAGRTLGEVDTVAVGEVIRVGATTLVVRRPPPRRPRRGDAFGTIPFHRTPYFPSPVRAVQIEAVPDVPSRPEKTRFAYLSAVLPLMMGVGLYLMLGSARYLVFIAFSPLMVIGNYLENRRRSGRTFRESVERFRRTLVERAGQLSAARAEERRRRFLSGPDMADLRLRAIHRSADLWVRDRRAEDFGRLRVGIGDRPTAIEVTAVERGDPEFRDEMADAFGDTETMTDVPITLDLVGLGVVAAVGRVEDTTALASSLAMQLCCLHSPEDLVVLGALQVERGLDDWLKWFPHTRSTSSPLDGPHLVTGSEGADALIGDLAKEAARRLAATGGPGGDGGDARFPWLVVFLDRSLEPDAAVLSRLLDVCPAAGMSIVWLTDVRERVPRQAQAVIDCRPAASGRPSRIAYTDPELPDELLDIERIDAESAADAARALAPVRDASSANAATAIPRTVPLFTALGIEAVDERWVANQWARERGYSLQGPIGVTDDGPLVLDLVEHGPHGLIGGTSGAGKSELLMSLVGGLVAWNPPSRVNFLFIDYKGGASSDLFKDVPHTVGYVTNLDGLLAKRALTSLRAELDRRMNLLQGRAKDLEEMIERYPDEAPPSLVIVVDEFATLVREIPDFVAGVVDIAQRGRSLGIHLILATQRPSGSINENITANTNLRMSLRMLDGSDSTAVIGTPDAAAIPAPLKGRGFARLGPGDLVAFQSAWSGAPLLAESGPPPVAVRGFGRSLAATRGDLDDSIWSSRSGAARGVSVAAVKAAVVAAGGFDAVGAPVAPGGLGSVDAAPGSEVVAAAGPMAERPVRPALARRPAVEGPPGLRSGVAGSGGGSPFRSAPPRRCLPARPTPPAMPLRHSRLAGESTVAGSAGGSGWAVEALDDRADGRGPSGLGTEEPGPVDPDGPTRPVERTQLDALLAAVIDAADAGGHGRGRAPWLDVLPSVVPLVDVVERDLDLDRPAHRAGERIVFGMVDDPERQAQYPAVTEPARSGGMLISGTGGSGKSTLLRTLAVAAARDDDARGGGGLTIVALDFASRALTGLAGLPQCAGVATGDDLEAVTRLIAVLHEEFTRRRQALAETAATGRDPVDEHVVMVLIDGMEALMQSIEQGTAGPGAAIGSDLDLLLTDGRQVGMYPFIAASRRSVFRASLTAAISDRVTLRQADAQGFADCGIGGPDAKDLSLAPGQGFFNGPRLVQVAIDVDAGLAPAASEDERRRAERARLREAIGGLRGSVAPRLRSAPLPRHVPLAEATDPRVPVVGVADLSGEPVALDLTYNNASVIGDPRSGRSTALVTIGRQVARAGGEVWVLASASSPLRGLEEAERVCFDESEERVRFVEGLCELVGGGGDTGGGAADGRPRLLLLDDYDLLPESDRALLGPLEVLLRSVRYVAAGAKPRGYSSSPVAQQIRTCRSLIYLRPHDGREAHEVVGVPVPWHPGLPMVEGRGLVVVDRVPVLAQLADPSAT